LIRASPGGAYGPDLLALQSGSLRLHLPGCFFFTAFEQLKPPAPRANQPLASGSCEAYIVRDRGWHRCNRPSRAAAAAAQRTRHIAEEDVAGCARRSGDHGLRCSARSQLPARSVSAFHENRLNVSHHCNGRVGSPTLMRARPSPAHLHRPTAAGLSSMSGWDETPPPRKPQGIGHPSRPSSSAARRSPTTVIRRQRRYGPPDGARRTGSFLCE